ncbi:hypothetical protein X975_16308, partial [Stegodyphus mimosarum]
MDPTSWSAYSQHFSRLGATMNHPPGSLSQQAQMNDLALPSSLPRQEHIPGYGNSGGPHHFLLAASHGLNPSQANHNDPSFNANLFAANYDASLFSTSFPSANKGHLSSFPQGAAGLFKAVNRENDFNDLRTGFSHCGMSAYARNSDGNNALSSGSGHLFPNSMPPSSWRHSGIIPPSCGPFGVLPHETVLHRSHLVGRGGDKLSVQASKQSRASLPSNSFVDQDLSRGYRSILSSPARPPSSYVDSSNTSHSSLLSPQGDPYFSSVSDNYYSSCSKNDFAAYSSYCSNVQPPVQRSSISPYCYSQTFGTFEPNGEKQDVPATSTNASANTNFSNFVPNSNLNGNSTHLHNGQISRQSVITSNISNNSVMYNSESHPQSHSYNIREAYPYPSGSAHPTSCLPSHSSNSSAENSGVRQAVAHNNHHSSVGQAVYPPMSTPIPASTPAHTTPPSSMGQAYVPTPLPLSHDSGCSSVNSQSVMYHSPSNDGCYSTPGTCHSESDSPAKPDISQHSSPSVYSIESSNLSMNSGPFAESHHVRSHSNSETNYGSNVMNGALGSEMHDNTNDSPKMIEENLSDVDPAVITRNCSSQQKEMHLSSVLPIDMVKLNKENMYQNSVVERSFDNRRPSIGMQNQAHVKHLDSLISSRSECSLNNNKSDVFAFSSDSPPPALDFTPKGKLKCKRGRKRRCDVPGNTLPLNCTYSHLQNNQQQLTSPETSVSMEENKNVLSNSTPHQYDSPPVGSELPSVTNSPLPVDLSHVSLNLSIKKQEDSMEEKSKVKDNMPELSYETGKECEEKWSVIKKDNSASDCETQNIDESENRTVENDIKKISKCKSPICRSPPLDDLSDESKKLCNSIEEDLGFLAGLSSDPDVEDSTSKGSFSEKKRKKEQGFLQSFLTFLEGSNEPTVSSEPVNHETKSEKEENVTSVTKNQEVGEKNEASVNEDHKNENAKRSNLIVEHDDKDNFDETPSLDPSLFGCSTLQKEMVVPNPEAPSFSSDEDENSTQGIFDSVAMAIQRLCEDNEEDHSEKNNKLSSGKSNTNKEEMPVLKNMNEVSNGGEQMFEKNESIKDDKMEECTIKSTCVMKTRKGKRRRTRHLLVIKVKRNTEKSSEMPRTPQTAMEKPKRTRNATKEVQIIKTVQHVQRRKLMRKCKERSLRKRNSGLTKRKPRNCVKRKYVYEEVEENTNVAVVKGCEPTEPAVEQQKEEHPVAEANSPEVQEVIPKKKKIYRSRTKRKRRGLKKSGSSSKPVTEPEVIKTSDEGINNASSNENDEITAKKSFSNGENCWNSETHFKTGDYVVSIESKNCEKPPIWRIEGKNVLQLFEALEDG